MPDAGKLNLRILWDGKTVHGVEVKSTRPPACRLLPGKSPDEAVQLIPLLYGVCGRAQRAAALAAVSSAQGRDVPQLEELEQGVLCEAMQEHLWRLLLDWPKLLGFPLLEAQFVRWHAALNALATGQGDTENLLAELHQVLLGMTAEEWRQMDTQAKLLECLKAGQGLLAPIIRALEYREIHLDFAGEQEKCDFLPRWTASDVSRNLAAQLGGAFAALPQLNGKPRETGALARTRHMPLLRDALRRAPTGLLARLIARLVDLLDSVSVRGRIGHDGRGLSVVQTARGMLLHHVRIESGRVAEYWIVAPTEWNFHPQGALTGLIGLREGNAARLRETALLFVLSLDPCVEFEIEVIHA